MSKLSDLFKKLRGKKSDADGGEQSQWDEATEIDTPDLPTEDSTEIKSSSDNTGSFFKRLAGKSFAKSNSNSKTPKAKKRKPKRKSSGALSFEELLALVFSPKTRPFIHSSFKFCFALAFSFSLAKMLALTLTPKESANLSSLPPIEFEPIRLAKDTRAIQKRNLFNSERVDDGKRVAKKKKVETGPCIESDRPGKSSIALMNTIVLQNEAKSIATLNTGGKNSFTNVRPGESVKGLGKIGRISRQKVFYRNATTNQCEFIASRQKPTKLKNKVKVLSASKGKELLKELNDQQGVKAEGNVFEIKREYLDQKLANLGDILTQARATPVPNPDGTLSFKITDVKPGSVYTVIGVENDDYISKIDGKPIRSVNEVLSLFRKIKSVNELNITVKRDGADQVLQYKIK